MALNIDTSRYFNAHGRIPGGRGMWIFFNASNQAVRHYGSYGQARRALPAGRYILGAWPTPQKGRKMSTARKLLAVALVTPLLLALTLFVLYKTGDFFWYGTPTGKNFGFILFNRTGLELVGTPGFFNPNAPGLG